MGGEFGWVIEARDMQLHDETHVCPFSVTSAAEDADAQTEVLRKVSDDL